MLRPRAPSNRRPPRGFALLVTIVLVAFLVLILVGLASFTRVETQVAGNAQALAQARQNALFSLNVALGELQRHLGPDQRATARADLLDAASPNPLWTGVWGNTAAPAADTPSPVALTWLVSGNERVAYDVVTAGDDFGRISSVTTAPSRLPTAAALDDTNSALLFGPGSTTRPGAYATVLAPLVDIEVPAGQIPGLGGSSDTPIGRYAWWADDESQKARLNLGDPHSGSNPAYSFGSAQRSAIELMAVEPEPAAYAGTPIGAALFPRAADTARILSAPQSAFAAPAGQEAALRSALRARSADYTVTAASVLADARLGGLKQDLTRILETTTPQAGPADADLLFPAPADLPAGSPYFAGPPSWGLLRSYAGLGAATVPARAQTETQAGVPPIPVWAELGFSVGYAGVTPAGFPTLHVFPRLVLWNPYDKPMNVPRLEFGMRGQNYIRLDGSPQLGVALATSRLATTGGGTPEFFRFIINPVVIPAGRAVLFTLAANNSPYLAGTNEMEPGDNRDFSAVITHSTPRAEPLTLTGFSSGENYFYVREVIGTDPPDPVPAANAASNEPPAGERMIKWAPRVGVAVSSTAPLSILAATAATAPQFRLVALARLGSAHGSAAGLPSRWIANGNLAAPFSLRAHTDSDYNRRANLYQGHLVSGSDDVSPLLNTSGGADDEHIAIGTAYQPRPDGRLALFATPAPGRPLFSIADLRHANIGHTDTGPAYAIGNSLADLRVPRQLAVRPWEDRTGIGSIPSPPFALFDHSFLANQALWDRYFFSTVPAGLTEAQLGDSLPNARMRPEAGASPDDLTNHRRAAAGLLLHGGFNVNSTSVQAWRAMLGALHGLPYDPVNDAPSGTALDRPFSRLARPLADSSDPWLGFRELTSEQLDALAQNIVAEIRARVAVNTAGNPGPFLTLAQFVNRRLVARNAASGEGAFGLKGALQAAIDTTDRESAAGRRLNLQSPYDANGTVEPTSGGNYDMEHLRGVTGASNVFPISSRNAFGPGHLTQADILSVVGPSLVARGDTFTIRVYGEVVSPLDPAQRLAQAWAEAVVQRDPDYVNETADAAETALASLIDDDNRRFGRRFTIVSFRWLTPADI